MSVELEWVAGGDRDAEAYLEPDDDEVPEADHAELCGGVADPGSTVFDGDDVHEVQNHLERHDARYKTSKVTEHRSPGDSQRCSQLEGHNVRTIFQTVRNRPTCHMKSLNVMIGPAMYNGG